MTQEGQPQSLEEIIELMKTPEYWGGIEGWREHITDQHDWAKLKLAHDAYWPSHIAEIIEGFNPEISKRSLMHPDHPDLAEYLAKIGDTYVVVSEDEVYIVGKKEQIDAIGATIILNAKVAVASTQDFKPNIDGQITWRRTDFEHDSIIPGFMIPDFQKLAEEFTVESLKQLEPMSYFYRARVGGSTYLRVSMDRIDVVGDTQAVVRITDILIDNHQDDILNVGDYCSQEYVAYNPNKKTHS